MKDILKNLFSVSTQQKGKDQKIIRHSTESIVRAILTKINLSIANL